MDLFATNWNVSIDDFDSLLTYQDESVWTTPDPSSPSFDSRTSPWFRGTFHNTTTIGASVTLNITGPAIYIYGDNGPAYGSYEVDIDSVSLRFSAYRASHSTPGSKLLFAATNLTYAQHNITLRNLGAQNSLGDRGGNAFLLDYVNTIIQLAPAGATVTNTTYQENDPAIIFTGTWQNNTGPNFSGGGTSFTNQDLASFSFSFHGSAIYVLGDKKNDHGIYTVTLDNLPAVAFNGVSGCGGAFGMTCEQQVPSMKYLASNLDSTLHNITLVNHAGVNHSFFDLDSIVVTVPQKYTPRQLSSGSSPFASLAPTSTIGASTVSAAPIVSVTQTLPSGAISLSTTWNPIFLVIFATLYLLCSKFRF